MVGTSPRLGGHHQWVVKGKGEAMGASSSVTFLGSLVLLCMGVGTAVAERISGLPGCGQPGVEACESVWATNHVGEVAPGA